MQPIATPIMRLLSTQPNIRQIVRTEAATRDVEERNPLARTTPTAIRTAQWYLASIPITLCSDNRSVPSSSMRTTTVSSTLQYKKTGSSSELISSITLYLSFTANEYSQLCTGSIPLTMRQLSRVKLLPISCVPSTGLSLYANVSSMLQPVDRSLPSAVLSSAKSSNFCRSLHSKYFCSFSISAIVLQRNSSLSSVFQCPGTNSKGSSKLTRFSYLALSGTNIPTAAMTLVLNICPADELRHATQSTTIPSVDYVFCGGGETLELRQWVSRT